MNLSALQAAVTARLARLVFRGALSVEEAKRMEEAAYAARVRACEQMGVPS